MNEGQAEILVIGYGNPGRQDDGLGPALAEAIDRLALPDVAVDSDYQLTVEHAEAAARHRTVVFADAAASIAAPFTWSGIGPGEAGIRFSSHHLEPADVLALARDLFGAEPEAFLLAIRGDKFGQFGGDLSPTAKSSLAAAIEHLTSQIREGFTKWVTPAGCDQ